MSKKYLDWANAGGPNECKHGYAKGIPCPRCDDEQAPRQTQERKTWHVGEANSYLGWEIMEDGDHGERCRGHINVRGVAQQIADDHNRLLAMETRLVVVGAVVISAQKRRKELEQALAALVEACDLVLRSAPKMYRGYWNGGQRSAVGEEALCCLDEALEQARAVLPTSGEDERRGGHE